MHKVVMLIGSFLDVPWVRRVVVLSSVSLYIILLPNIFADICEHFSSVKGYEYYKVELFDVLLYEIIAIFPALFLPWSGRLPSSVVVWVVYFLHIVPSIVLFPLVVNVPFVNGVLWTTTISVLFVCAILFIKHLKFSLPVINFSYKVVSDILILITILSIIAMVSTFGINFNLPSVDDVYGVRSEYKSKLIDSGSFLIGYIAIIGGFAISPLLINLAILFRKGFFIRSLVMGFLAFFLLFIIYGSAGFKSVAFAWVLSLFSFLILRKVKNFGFLLAVMLPLFVLVNLLVAKYLGLEIVLYHWIRRVFIVPGMNTSYFYEYISSSGIDYLDNAPLVISQIYYGTDGSANAGLSGDGLARFGHIGLLFNMGLFTIMMKICDAVSRRGNAALSSAVFMLSAYAISNSSLTSVLITYGYLLVAVVLFFVQSSIQKLGCER